MKREFINTIFITFAILAVAAVGAYPVFAEGTGQPTFKAPAEASKTLFDAVQRNDEQSIARILGGPAELASSPDEDRELFVQKYEQMHRLRREPDGSVVLYIGAENFPFPFPLVEKNGVWSFDPNAGMKEITFRRVGENELTAIAVCREFAEAQKHNAGPPIPVNHLDTSLANLLAKPDVAPTGDNPTLFHGYYYKILPKPTTKGEFTLVAYPAEYRSSGVMTFVAKPNQKVYEKDLGADGSSAASAMTVFHKDATWRIAHE